MKNKLLCLSAMVFASFLVGCNNSTPSAAPVAKYKIDLYSGGVYLGSWNSERFPRMREYRSFHGYEFVDTVTGKKVVVRGDVVITELPATSPTKPDN